MLPQEPVTSPAESPGTPRAPSIRVSRHEQLPVGFVSVTGEIDVSTAEPFRRRLLQVLAGRPERVVVRLADVQYMDSAGVAVLLEVLREARKSKTELVLLEPSGAVRRAIGMVELQALVTIHGCVGDCAKSLGVAAESVAAHVGVA